MGLLALVPLQAAPVVPMLDDQAVTTVVETDQTDGLDVGGLMVDLARADSAAVSPRAGRRSGAAFA